MVYLYGLLSLMRIPTEPWVNKGFMELALPYLESLDYVERYAWFQPNSGVADYYENDNYTAVGEFYKNQISTPAIPNASLSI